MTWYTSEGERKLGPKEGKLFINAVAVLCDLAMDCYGGDKGKLNYGYPVIEGAFQRLTEPQKCSVLLEVSKLLLEDTPTMPELTAVNESAVWYVYRWLQLQFDDVEGGEYVWGQHIIDALRETGIAQDMEECDEDDEDPWMPSIGCLDADKWEQALDALADRILWDRDWEMEGMFAGMAPGTASGLRATARISEGYFQPYTKRARSGALEALKQYTVQAGA